jgi:uncharacterized protein (DUF305 family)
VSNRLRAVALISSALIVAGCSGSDDDRAGAPIVQIGAPGVTNRVLTDDELDALTVPAHTLADVAFVHGMIAHHQQALVMTALVEERTDRTDLPLLAERMDVSQRDEMAQMEQWLAARDVQLPEGEDHAAHTGLMPGMLTPEQLDALAAAEGEDFDRLFLESMITHHLGAVQMVEELLTGGFGGQEPQVFQLAQHIEADQQVEIARMRTLLAELEQEGS